MDSLHTKGMRLVSIGFMLVVADLLQRYRTGGDQSVLEHMKCVLFLVAPVEAVICVHQIVERLGQVLKAGHVVRVLAGQTEKRANLLFVRRNGERTDLGHFHRINSDAVLADLLACILGAGEDL